MNVLPVGGQAAGDAAQDRGGEVGHPQVTEYLRFRALGTRSWCGEVTFCMDRADARWSTHDVMKDGGQVQCVSSTV